MDIVEMTEEQKYDLRQQMYAWVITSNIAKDREEAKVVLKHNGFLAQPIRYKEIIKKVEVVPDDIKIKSDKWDQLKTLLSI